MRPDQVRLDQTRPHQVRRNQNTISALGYVAENLLTLGILVGPKPSVYSVPQGDHAEVARLLLAGRANIKAISNGEQTPLHVAIYASGNIEIVKLLLEKRASVDVEDGICNTPLDIAILKNNTEIVQLLQKYTAEA